MKEGRRTTDRTRMEEKREPLSVFFIVSFTGGGRNLSVGGLFYGVRRSLELIFLLGLSCFEIFQSFR